MPTSITLECEGFGELAGRLQMGGSSGRIVLNDGLRKIARLLVPAKGTGPLAVETPKRTGKLARSTFFQIVGGPGNQILQILQPARSPRGDFYGFYVREKTKPHEIRPVNARALRWETEAGEIRFAMRVQHPGSAANPYHRRVMARLLPRIQQVVNEMGAKLTLFLSSGG